jgi:hypothetical protein
MLNGTGDEKGTAAAAIQKKLDALERYMRTLNDAIEQAKLEVSLIGQSARVRAQELAVLEASRAAREDFIAGIRTSNTLTEREIALIKAKAGELFDYEKKLADSQAEAQQWQQLWQHAAENMLDAFAGGFKKLFTGGINGFKDFAKTVLNIMVDLAAQIAALLVFRPIVGSILGGLDGMGLPGVRDAAEAGGYGNYLSNAGSIAGLTGMTGGVGNAINAFGVNQLGMQGLVNPVNGQFVGIQGAPTLTGVLGGAAAGALVGNLLARLTGGNKTGSTIGGGLVGAGIMTANPWLIGAGAVTALISSIFGPPKPDRTEGVQYDLTTNTGKLVGEQPGTKKYSQENVDISNQFATTLAGIINALKATGASVSQSKFTFATGDRDGSVFYYGTDANQQKKFNSPSEALNYAISEAFKGLGNKSAELQKIIDNVDYNNLEAFVAQLNALVAWNTTLEGIDDRILQLKDPKQYELSQLDKVYQPLLDKAREMGTGLAKIEEAYGLERQAILAKYNTAANDNIAKATERMTSLLEETSNAMQTTVETQIGALQSLAAAAAKAAADMEKAAFDLKYDPRRMSPADRISALTPLFDETLSKVLSGDVSATDDLKDIGDRLLEAAEKAYGTTAPFQALAQKIENGYNTARSAALGQVSIAQQQLDVLNAQLEELKRIAAGRDGSTPISQTAATLDDINALNAQYATAYNTAKSGGISDADWVKSAEFGQFQSALVNRISNLGDVDWLKQYFSTLSSADTSGVLGDNIKVVKNAVQARLRALGIPGYASGGWHAGGLRMVGEQGMELEVTGPARYYSSSQTRSLMAEAMNDNAGMAGKLDVLISQNARMLSHIGNLVQVNKDQRTLIKDQNAAIERRDRQLRDMQAQQRKAG